MKRILHKLLMLSTFVTLLLFVVSCAAPVEEINYPHTIYKLSDAGRISIAAEFRELNNMNKIGADGMIEEGIVLCPGNVYFDEFGLLSTYSGCIKGDTSTAPSKTKAIEVTKEFLTKNKKFVGINNPSELEVSKYEVQYTGTPTLGSIMFKNQKYRGIEVENTGIAASASGEGVFAVSGTWYPNITIPHKENITKRAVKGILKNEGYTTIYSIDKAIYPLELPHNANAEKLEFRLVWKTYASKGNSFNTIFYVDAIIGEIIAKTDLFITN